MTATLDACPTCGTAQPPSDSDPPFTGPHCSSCPPWVCEVCGELTTMAESCSCWVTVEGIPHADIKALFAADGTFSVGIDGKLTAS